MGFDLDLAKSKTNENPVYYIQYAHARICSVFGQADEKEIERDVSQTNLTLLTEEIEKDLLRGLSRFKGVLE